MGVGAKVALRVRVTAGKIGASVKVSVSARVGMAVEAPSPL